jgi:hypothetical protein
MATSMEFVTLTRPKADMNSKAVLKQRIARLAGDSVRIPAYSTTRFG